MNSGFWTHPSVRGISKNLDPIEAVLARAQDLTLEAIENGWSGPPFDAFELAKLCDIQVLPREDVGEARLMLGPTGKLEVHYNPLRPKTRVKFSIAHEVAHSLFPDCTEAVRHRGARFVEREDEWQLEILCNLAAGELLMPIGSFQDFNPDELAIDRVIEWRRKYEVSIEAMLLRILRLSKREFFVFSASTYDGESYSFDYVIDSSGARKRLYGKSLPKESLFKNCSAVGFTEKGDDIWPEGIGAVRFECCAIPPFPGQSYPRAVGFARPQTVEAPGENFLKEVKGDALALRGEGRKLLIHLVNDKAASWGAGFAKSVAKRYPKSEQAYREHIMKHGRFHLGDIFSTQVSHDLEIVQLVAQMGFGHSGPIRIRYLALRECLGKVAKLAFDRKSEIHMPRIGTGFGGGSWSFVRELVDQEICRKRVSVTVYDFESAQVVKSKQPSLFN
jgi:O-acetyl-ADP-ribose deacetylase (regulator of RNase III)